MILFGVEEERSVEMKRILVMFGGLALTVGMCVGCGNTEPAAPAPDQTEPAAAEDKDWQPEIEDVAKEGDTASGKAKSGCGCGSGSGCGCGDASKTGGSGHGQDGGHSHDHSGCGGHGH